MFICNPIPPTLPDDGDLDNGYWDEVDRYCDELILQEMFNKEKERNEEHNNQMQEQRRVQSRS